MTTDPTPPPTDTPEKVTAGTLRTWIKEEVLSAFTSNKPADTPPTGTGTPPTTDIKSQVAEALSALRKREERESRDAEVDKLLEAAKKPPENTPVERRRVHKIMGWGE